MLALVVEGRLNALDPTTLVNDLTGGGYTFGSGEPLQIWSTLGCVTKNFSKVTDKLGPELGNQIENENSGISFANGAVLIVTKPFNGSTFLRSVDINFAGDLDWTIIHDHVALKDVSLGVSLDHPTSSSPWTAMLTVDALTLINHVNLGVSGQVSLDETPKIELAVNATPLSNTAPEDLLDVFIAPGTSSIAESKLRLPPTADVPLRGQNAFEADITIAKDDKGWYIASANALLRWQTTNWYPVEGVDIALQGVYFQYLAQREVALDAKLPSQMPLDFAAAFGGSLVLVSVPVSVVVTYESKSDSTVMTCLVDDAQDLSLQQIAADSLFNHADQVSRSCVDIPIHACLHDRTELSRPACNTLISPYDQTVLHCQSTLTLKLSAGSSRHQRANLER